VYIWEAPNEDYTKCNVGFSWSKKKMLGESSVLRNCTGETLLHRRRAFGNIGSFLDGKFISMMWAIEAMRSHHVDKVEFVT